MLLALAVNVLLNLFNRMVICSRIVQKANNACMPRRRAQNTRPQMFLPSKRLFSDQVPHGLRSSSCITVLKMTLRHNYWRKVRILSKISQKNYKENRAKLLAKLTSLRISSFSALTILLRSSLTSISS